MAATSGVQQGVDKADFMGELVKEEAELQEVMQMENVEKHLGKKIALDCNRLYPKKKHKKAEDWDFVSNALKSVEHITLAFLVARLVKNPPAMQETLVRFLSREDALEKGYAAHSGILELPGRLSW